MTDKADISKIMARIAKMLKLSRDAGATEGEAATAAGMAARLMHKYQIEHADIVMQELNESGAVVSEEIQPGRFRQACPSWYFTLAVLVADLFDCKVRNEVTKDERYVNLAVFGFKPDVEVVRHIFLYLENQFNVLALSAWKTNLATNEAYHHVDTPNPSVIRRWKDNYKMGLFFGIESRLKDLYKKDDDEVTADQKAGFDLVVVCKKKRIQEVFGDIGYKSKTVKDNDGLREGMKDAHLVRVNKAMNTPSTDCLLLG